MAKKVLGVRSRQLSCGIEKTGSKMAFLKNMHIFIKEFNEKTKDQNGKLVTVKITLYSDFSYRYQIRDVPSSSVLREIAGKDRVLTEKQLDDLVKRFLPYTNTDNENKVRKILLGTARSAGIRIVT